MIINDRIRHIECDTAIISDIHMGKRSSNAAAVLEFLQHLKCRRLILAGDIFDEWELGKRKHWRLPEMQIRGMDEINRLKAEGVEVIWIHGNHEPALRRFAKNLLKRMNRSRVMDEISRIRAEPDGSGTDRHAIRRLTKGIMKKIKRERRDESVRIGGITLTQGYRFRLGGKVIDTTHGDEIDSPAIRRAGDIAHSIGHRLNMIGVYDATLRRAADLRRFQKSLWLFRDKQSMSEQLANMTPKQRFRALGHMDHTIMEKAVRDGVDVKVCGHSHVPRDIRNGTHYLNAGCWVEHATAVVIDDEGDARLIDWNMERKQLGLTRLPSESDPATALDYRAESLLQLRLIQRLTSGWKRGETLFDIAKIQKKIARKGHLADTFSMLAHRITALREDGVKNADALRDFVIHELEGHGRAIAGYGRAAARGGHGKDKPVFGPDLGFIADELDRVIESAWSKPVAKLSDVFRRKATKYDGQVQSLRKSLAAEQKKLRPWHDISCLAK